MACSRHRRCRSNGLQSPLLFSLCLLPNVSIAGYKFLAKHMLKTLRALSAVCFHCRCLGRCPRSSLEETLQERLEPESDQDTYADASPTRQTSSSLISWEFRESSSIRRPYVLTQTYQTVNHDAEQKVLEWLRHIP